MNFMFNGNMKMQSGQALVMMLLILGIALTVGMSVISRSVNEVSVSTTTEESNRALEAAEQGVQKSLAGIIAMPGGADVQTNAQNETSSTVQVKNAGVAGTTNTPFRVPFSLRAGEVVTVDLVTYPLGNNVGLCWGDNTLSSPGTPPAIEVILYYDTPSSEKRAGRIGIDGSNSGRGGFSGTNGGANCGGDYQASHSLNLGSLATGGTSPLILRVRMLYNNQPQTIAVLPQSGFALPMQGLDVVSTGQSGSATQRLHVIQTDPDLPFMFDSALFSGAQLVQ